MRRRGGGGPAIASGGRAAQPRSTARGRRAANEQHRLAVRTAQASGPRAARAAARARQRSGLLKASGTPSTFHADEGGEKELRCGA